MAYGDFKDLTRWTASDKILRDKSFNIAKIQNIMDIKGVLLQWFINFLIKNPLVERLKIKISQKNNCLKSYTNQLLNNARKT